jgi:hypothetical protein
MRIPVLTAALMGAVILTASPAQAQLCAGAPSFRTAPYQVGVNTAFTSGAQGVGGHFAAGGGTLFGGGGVGFVNYSDLDSSAAEVSGFAGADLSLTSSERVFVCPMAQIAFGVGPDIGIVDASTFAVEGGGSVGVMASQTEGLSIIPTFAVTVIYTKVSFDTGAVDNSQSDGSGVASVGVGFLLNENVSITPSIGIPFSTSDSDPIFRIRFAFQFGS